MKRHGIGVNSPEREPFRATFERLWCEAFERIECVRAGAEAPWGRFDTANPPDAVIHAMRQAWRLGAGLRTASTEAGSAHERSNALDRPAPAGACSLRASKLAAELADLKERHRVAIGLLNDAERPMVTIRAFLSREVKA